MFSKAASFYERIGYHGPFIITIDATAILPCIRVKGNKLIGIATEEDIVVKTAQDIIFFFFNYKVPVFSNITLFTDTKALHLRR